jgi:DNA (cytosine-5)-methyltransferase 1
MVAFRDGEDFDWGEVRPATQINRLDSILHKEDGSEAGEDYVDPQSGRVDSKYTLSDGLWAYLQAYAAKHKAAGNGFGYGLVTGESSTRTLSARYYKDGSEILLAQKDGKNPRRLTPRECARLMGFEDSFVIPVSDTQAYKQFGNSVAVPVIASASKQLIARLNKQ